MKKIFFLSFLLIGSSLSAQNYIGADSIGLLSLRKNHIFYLNYLYHDLGCKIDSGIYYKNGDEIVLNSIIPPVTIKKTRCLTNDTIIYFNSLDVTVYDSLRKEIQNYPCISDSTNNGFSPCILDSISMKNGIYSHLKDVHFAKGDLVSFQSTLGKTNRNIIWNTDIDSCLKVQIDTSISSKLYFNNFTFKIKGNELIPVKNKYYKIFKRVNFYDDSIDFPIMHLAKPDECYYLLPIDYVSFPKYFIHINDHKFKGLPQSSIENK